jgi:hypothetical protein
MLDEGRNENATGSVAAAENQRQGHEQARDDNPTLFFAMRH